MITVAEEIKKIILNSPLLESGMAEGIINLSALARKIRPQVEENLVKPVSESAILMALKRLSQKIKPALNPQIDLFESTGDMTVRSNLSEFTFTRSPSLLACQRDLLLKVKENRESFVTFKQGIYETTIIVNSQLESMVKKIFQQETVLSHLQDLSAITLRLTPATVHTPGVHYSILKQLAWHGLNIIEVVSTFTEFTIVIKKAHVEKSLSVLLRFLSENGNQK